MNRQVELLVTEAEKLLDWGDTLRGYGDKGVANLNTITKDYGGDFEHIVRFGFARNFFVKKADKIVLSDDAMAALDETDGSGYEDAFGLLGWHEFLKD